MEHARRTLVSLGMLLLILSGAVSSLAAREFFCSGGDVGCLSDAINVANVNGEENTIHLEAGSYGYIGVRPPAITGRFPLTITGHSPDTFVSARVPGGTPIIFVAPQASLTLQGLRIGTGPSVPGIRNEGTLNVVNTVISVLLPILEFQIQAPQALGIVP